MAQIFVKIDRNVSFGEKTHISPKIQKWTEDGFNGIIVEAAVAAAAAEEAKREEEAAAAAAAAAEEEVKEEEVIAAEDEVVDVNPKVVKTFIFPTKH